MATLCTTPSAAGLESSIGVLIVSANENLRTSLRQKLDSPRWALSEAGTGADALEKMYQNEKHVLLLDPVLPDLETNEFSALLNGEFPDVQIVTVNSHTGQPLVRRRSTNQFASELVDVLERGGPIQLARTSDDERNEEHAYPASLPGMVGRAPSVQRVYAVARLVSRRDTTVMITGESGTGKDLIAQAIHGLSGRRSRPFVVVNCAAIPEALLEAELFGYVKGAFTGAVQSRIGRLQSAQGGTLFLDEIGEMPLALQSKLLRFLEQGELQRLGSSDNFRIDVRVVAATNANLRMLVDQKLFREDLYYRLAVFPIHLPPLRERVGDVALLANSFASKFMSGSVVSGDALTLLESHPWPGNVRELRNVIERATILMGHDQEIQPEHIIL